MDKTDREIQQRMIPLLKQQGCKAEEGSDCLVGFSLGSAGGRIRREDTGSDPGIRIIIPIITGARVPESYLADFPNRAIDEVSIGAFSCHLRDDGSANLIVHNGMLVACGYPAIARTAFLMILWVDAVDDRFQAAFGGTRWADVNPLGM